MAKLSLWLLTLAKDKPFEFLDHAIRCGDSLVGIHDLDQLRHLTLSGRKEESNLFLSSLEEKVSLAIEVRKHLEQMEIHTVEDVEQQERLYRRAATFTEELR